MQVTYKKAQDILPSELINEVQKYLDGGLIYFPKKTERRKWGSVNGTHSALVQRNQDIRTLYAQGYTYEMLSKQFCLSEDSIRKIVKQNGICESREQVSQAGKINYK